MEIAQYCGSRVEGFMSGWIDNNLVEKRWWEELKYFSL